MIARIIKYSIQNKVLVLVLTLFLVIAGAWATAHSSLDAVPDLSDVQVIVVTDYPGQAPAVVDQQVTYPLTTALMGLPNAKVVRGISMFETSMIYIIFKDGTDLYWARSRVLEYLNFARDRLPQGVQPKLGPDATGVGWVYQYILNAGFYDPDCLNGLWEDKDRQQWFPSMDAAPAERREHLVKVRAFDKAGNSPLSGKPLVAADQNLATLRSLQDWYLRYQLTSVEGIAEVAPIGGFVRQYQIVVKPEKLLAYKLSIKELMMAVQRSNNDVGGSVVEMSGMEYMVRSRAYLHGLTDLAKVPVGIATNGVPIMLSDVATLQIAGEERRGIGEWNGEGEAVGGVVVARFGVNAYKVIHDAKEKLAQLEEGLPPGVTIKTAYDRSALIERSLHTLRHTLIEEMTIVAIVCVLFLLHGRSALVAIFVLPTSVLASLLIMHLLDISANIMSLGGIAIAIGVVVDSAIIMVENAHKHMNEEEQRVRAGATPRTRTEVMIEAAQEVGPSLFFSLVIITVSFLPVFAFGGESGRLFRPLALTKSFAMASAAVLSITIIPVLMDWFVRDRLLPARWNRWISATAVIAAIVIPALVCWYLPTEYPQLLPYRFWMTVGWLIFASLLFIPQRIIHEEHSPISRVLQWFYNPAFFVTIRLRWLMIVLAIAFVATAIWPLQRLGSEFMPPLDEGDLLYMPTTDPSISVTTARQLLQQTDKLIKTFPEVMSVYGKIGRADSATDPAPLDMVESVVRLNPDPTAWRHRTVNYFFSRWPSWAQWPFLNTFWPSDRRITMDELVSGWTDADGISHAGLNSVVHLPGVGNLWPMPIDNRLKMLSTGIKSPIGLKIMGPDLQTLSDLSQQAVSILTLLPGTTSASTEPAFGGYYMDVDIDREKAARYGLTTGDVQDVISSAMGGMNISTAVEGLERYPINIRYARDLRNDPDAIRNILIPTPSGPQIPLGEVATLAIRAGAPMVRSENGRQTAFVYLAFDTDRYDLGSFVARVQQAINTQLHLPAGYNIVWSGQFEQQQEDLGRLKIVVPTTLVIIVLLLYFATKSIFRVLVVMLAVPFSLVGAVWLLWLLGYHLSGAVWVGMIALAGLDAETGLVMLLYLDNSFERFKSAGRMRSARDLYDAVHDGAVKRIRPKTMTVAVAFLGLVPLLWAQGTGADVMRRLAAPLLGGLFTSFLMELLIYPAIFYIAKSFSLPRRANAYEGGI